MPQAGQTAQVTGVPGTSTSQAPGANSPAPKTAAPSIDAPVPEDEGHAVIEEVVQQQLQSGTDQDAGTPRPAANVVLNRDEVLIRADEQEKVQDVYKVRGNVEIRFRNSTIHCDQATYDSTTGQITANGHVVYDGGTRQEHIVGTHATYDVSRDTGTFYDVTGSIGIQVKNQAMFLRSSTPFFFTGKVVDKLGPDLVPGASGNRHFLPASQTEVGVSSGDRRRGGWAATPRCITPPCASREFRSFTFPTCSIRWTTSDARAAS